MSTVADWPEARSDAAPVAAAPRCRLGESPRWEAGSGRLWWVDLLVGHVHCLEVGTGEHTMHELGRPVSALARHATGWVVAVETGVQYRDEAFQLLAELDVLARPALVRMNDAALDPVGRFVVGTLAYDGRLGADRLLSVDGGGVRQLLAGLSISNGLAWSADGCTLFHVDSGARTVTSYEYDAATGDLGAARTCYQHEEDDALPDGIALDADGGLWVALWGGGRVIRVDTATGTVTDRVHLEATQPAGVAFGGADLRTLYVTSARVDLPRELPGDGALFAVRTVVPGLPQKLVNVTPETWPAASSRYSA